MLAHHLGILAEEPEPPAHHPTTLAKEPESPAHHPETLAKEYEPPAHHPEALAKEQNPRHRSLACRALQATEPPHRRRGWHRRFKCRFLGG
jgi:hypothetical protein